MATLTGLNLGETRCQSSEQPPQSANPTAAPGNSLMPSNSWCATQQPCSHAAGISRSSRQRIATL